MSGIELLVLVYLYSEEIRQADDDQDALEAGSYDDARDWTFQSLAETLKLSKSTVHRAIKTAEKGQLLLDKTLVRSNLNKFLLYGAPVLFPAKIGSYDYGTPTSMTASLFSADYQLVATTPYVWPNPVSPIKGLSIQPICPQAVAIAEKNQGVHRILAALDGLRLRNARENDLANRYLSSLEASV